MGAGAARWSVAQVVHALPSRTFKQQVEAREATRAAGQSGTRTCGQRTAWQRGRDQLGLSTRSSQGTYLSGGHLRFLHHFACSLNFGFVTGDIGDRSCTLPSWLLPSSSAWWPPCSSAPSSACLPRHQLVADLQLVAACTVACGRCSVSLGDPGPVTGGFVVLRCATLASVVSVVLMVGESSKKLSPTDGVGRSNHRAAARSDVVYRASDAGAAVGAHCDLQHGLSLAGWTRQQSCAMTCSAFYVISYGADHHSVNPQPYWHPAADDGWWSHLTVVGWSLAAST